MPCLLQGNILDDASAVNILSESKTVSNEIQQKEHLSELTRVEVEAARASYQPCGAANATLFFCIADLASQDPMYQYSLGWFISLFVRSIQGSCSNHQAPNATKDTLQHRLDQINSHFLYSVYSNVCTSLFQKDKLMFAFHLATRILLQAGTIDADSLRFFLSNGAGFQPMLAAPKNPENIWDEDTWSRIVKLPTVMLDFLDFPHALASDAASWRDALDSADPHLVELPGQWSARLSPFHKLLMVGLCLLCVVISRLCVLRTACRRGASHRSHRCVAILGGAEV